MEGGRMNSYEMSTGLHITSTKNPRVKRTLELRERRDRDAQKLFLIEGYRELKRAADAKIQLEELFICTDLFLGFNESTLIAQIKAQGTTVYTCSENAFAKLSYRDRPDGLLGVAKQMQQTFTDLPKKAAPFFLIAESIEKPGNLGTILRSADAAGVDGVIVCDRCTDIYNPNVVRASVGTLFTIPVVEASTQETLDWLRQNQIQIVAATPDATLEFTEADFSGPVAIVVGTEQLGLSAPWFDAASIQVRIPMQGVADSLNVSSATTLLLYEVLRQRKYARSVL
jgi:TrmH family RNA methyltransferase